MQEKIFSIYIPGTDFNNNYQSNTINGQIDCNVILAGMFHKCQVVDQYIYIAFSYFSVLLNEYPINFYFNPIISRLPQENIFEIFWYSNESRL